MTTTKRPGATGDPAGKPTPAPAATTPGASAAASAPAASRLEARGVVAGYNDRTVLDGVDLTVLDGELTVILGPNACGKSTLLRTMARMLDPTGGQVLLDGQDVHRMRTREVALRLGLLPQSPQSPDGMIVRDLVGRGRFPHQKMLRQWSPEDEAAVDRAMARAGVSELADRSVDALSGGQRQRVWIAMVLAQETELLLMDEPTTYLDIVFQIEVLDLARSLQRDGRTVVVVLHDLNLALRYATHIVFMREGAILAQGAPKDIVDAELLERVYGLKALVIPDPLTDLPMVVPRVS